MYEYAPQKINATRPTLGPEFETEVNLSTKRKIAWEGYDKCPSPGRITPIRFEDVSTIAGFLACRHALDAWRRWSGFSPMYTEQAKKYNWIILQKLKIF